MSDPILHYERVPAAQAPPAQWLYVLHGIFGAGRNWASIARRLVQRRPEWGALLVDLREHGRSRGFAPPHTIAAAASDLAPLIAESGLQPAAVLGHSFGGKVALRFARDAAAATGLRQVWVIDSVPAVAPEPRGGAWQMLGLLRRQPGPFESRAELIAALEAEGVDNGVAQWVSTNLQAAPSGELRWRIDLDAMESLLRDFFREDLWDVLEHPPGALAIHFVRARGSDVMTDEVAARIRAIGRANGRVALHELDGGHWLNADNPDGLVELLAEEL